VHEAVQRLAEELLAGRGREAAETPLTLAEGFDRALDLASGKYPTKSRRWEEVNRARAKLERLLGKHTAFARIGPGELRRVWRTLADEALRAARDGAIGGARQAEVTIDAFYSVATWLEDEGSLEPGTVVPIRQWRAKLKEDWRKKTGASVQPTRLRHTAEEWTSLFAALTNPDVDPRFRLLFDLGAEQRLGQVLRCMRSNLELPMIVATRARAGEVGELRVPGDGKKRTAPITLSVSQRAAVETALTGYLSHYEEAFRSGKLHDYPLFPAGRLKRGKAKIAAAAKPLTRDAALKMFRTLEGLAGVPHVPGRGWYGVRRVATDLAEDFEQDERVLNSLTGHKDSTTRRLVYQDRERPQVLARAAELREQMRTAAVGSMAARTATGSERASV
jgi:hypothetical protein